MAAVGLEVGARGGRRRRGRPGTPAISSSELSARRQGRHEAAVPRRCGHRVAPVAVAAAATAAGGDGDVAGVHPCIREILLTLQITSSRNISNQKLEKHDNS